MPHTVRLSGTPLPKPSVSSSAPSQCLATTWRTPRHSRVAAPPATLPSFSSGNAFGPLAPQRRRRHSPHLPRSTATRSSDLSSPSSSQSSSTTLPASSPLRRRRGQSLRVDSITIEELRHLLASAPRRRRKGKISSRSPPATTSRLRSSSRLVLTPPPTTTSFSPSPLRRLHRLQHGFDAVTFDNIRRLATATPRRRSSTPTTSLPPALLSCSSYRCPTYSLSPRSGQPSSPWRPPPPPPTTEFPVVPPPTTTSLSPSPLRRLHRVRHGFDAVTFEDIRRISAGTPDRRSSTPATLSPPASLSCSTSRFPSHSPLP